jgi:hypothetical protein
MKFDAALAEFLRLAQEMIVANNAASTPVLKPRVLSTMNGVRYVRVVIADASGAARCAYAFIDRTTGDILKPDGWKRPAKGVRGNIFAANPIAGVGPYGANYAR